MNKDSQTNTTAIAANTKLTAVYTTQQKSLMVLLPKKRGVGFRKSVFGFHSKNDDYRTFDSVAPYWFVGDVFDVDGYLQIDLRLNSWDEKYREGLRLTISALKWTFKYVSEFKEDDESFWNALNCR